VLAVVALVGAADLISPTLGDQALYLTYANKLATGGVLYRDVWDIKQPGIFYFYECAIELFGRGAVGVHALELIWMLGLALALQIGLRPYFNHPWTKALVALPTVGLYYAVAAPFLGQVEGLIALPLFLTLWALMAAVRNTRLRRYAFFAAGVAGGVVLCFKLVYLIVIAAMYVVAMVAIVRRSEERGRIAAIASSLVTFALGAMLPIAIVGLIVLRGVDARTLYETTFVDPGRILREHGGAPLRRLFQSATYFAKIFAPIIILTIAGGFVALRRRDRLLTFLLVTWLVSGFTSILIQTWSWWQHHFLLLWVPLGIFGTKWFDAALDWAARGAAASDRRLRRIAVACGITLLFIPAALQPATNAYMMLRARNAPWTDEGRIAFQSRRSSLYRKLYGETAFLRDESSRQGSIFVCGSPINYVLANRGQALRADGYSLDLQLPEQWTQFTNEFATKRPAFVYIDSECESLLRKDSPTTISMLGSDYRMRRRFDDGGMWYELR
jgi:hypothetical protein